jgi:hypothetical protein
MCLLPRATLHSDSEQGLLFITVLITRNGFLSLLVFSLLDLQYLLNSVFLSLLLFSSPDKPTQQWNSFFIEVLITHQQSVHIFNAVFIT